MTIDDSSGLRRDWMRRQLEHGNVPRAVLMKGVPAAVNDAIDRWHRQVLGAVLAKVPAGCVLDIGCGFGRLANEAATLGHVPVGIDFTPKFCAGFAARFGMSVCGDQTRPPFADNVFAAAYSVTSLMYLDERRAILALAELDRCLAPGAIVLVLEPCREFNSLARTLWPSAGAGKLAVPGFALETFRRILPAHWQSLGAGACTAMTFTLPLLILAARWPRLSRLVSSIALALDRPRLDGARARGKIALYRWVACRKPV